MNDYTILINSCDGYCDLWPYFMECFKKAWPSKKEVFLNTESKQFFDNEINVISINSEKRFSWSKRLKYVLKRIKTEYVLVFLDDFFLESIVDEAMFCKYFDIMCKNKNVGCIYFKCTPDGISSSHDIPGFALLEKKAKYRVNCQVAIWNRKFLISLLRNHETAWEFEKMGSFRSRRYRKLIYSPLEQTTVPFDYNWGKPVFRGKWNIKAVNQIKIKTGVNIDTKDREAIEDIFTIKSKRKRTLKEYFRMAISIF